MTTESRIVAKVLALVRRGDAVLVLSGTDPNTGSAYHRPLGGSIEFGETSAEALVREMHEELGAAVEPRRLLGVLEARFVFEGRPRHELLFVWEATFADPALLARDELHGTEIDGSPIHARWLPLPEARAGRVRLVPEGLLALLDAGRALP